MCYTDAKGQLSFGCTSEAVDTPAKVHQCGNTDDVKNNFCTTAPFNWNDGMGSCPGGDLSKCSLPATEPMDSASEMARFNYAYFTGCVTNFYADACCIYW